MLTRTYFLEETLDIALTAKEYARTQILSGCTQLEINSLSKEHLQLHILGVKKMRASVDDIVRDKVNQFQNEILATHETSIALSSKFSIGNCQEYAEQALDYCLHNHADLSAEIYTIVNGDHEILVLNRDPESKPDSPDTWGEQAVICDPWANKAYPASEYLTQLKCYHFDRLNTKNCITDFIPRVNKLSIEKNINTAYLKKAKEISKLTLPFRAQVFSHSALDDYIDDVEMEINNLVKKYGINQEKVVSFKSKIQTYEESLDDFCFIMEKINSANSVDEEQLARLKAASEAFNDAAVKIKEFRVHDLEIFQHRSKTFRFFNQAMKNLGCNYHIKTNTEKKLERLRTSYIKSN